MPVSGSSNAASSRRRFDIASSAAKRRTSSRSDDALARPQPREQHLRVDRLGLVVVDSGVVGLDDPVLVRNAREHDDIDAAPDGCAAQRAAELQRGRVRARPVDHDELGTKLHRLLQRSAAVRRGQDGIPCAIQDLVEILLRRCVVVDDQQS
jgi:hypothetical protein